MKTAELRFWMCAEQQMELISRKGIQNKICTVILMSVMFYLVCLTALNKYLD
jgi:hypothetical protein